MGLGIFSFVMSISAFRQYSVASSIGLRGANLNCWLFCVSVSTIHQPKTVSSNGSGFCAINKS